MSERAEGGLIRPGVLESLSTALGAIALLVAAVGAATSGWNPLATVVPAAVAAALILLAVARRARQRRRARGDDARMRALLHSTLESTTDGILTVDLSGNIVSYNQRYLELWGLDAEGVTGSLEQRLYLALRQVRDPDAFLRRVEHLTSSADLPGHDVIEFVDGRVMERSTQPHRLDGRIVGRVWSFRDVTEQRRTERALAESEGRFRRMVTNVPGVIFQFYVRRDGSLWFTYLSEGCQALLGVQPPSFPWQADSLVERVHESDMKALRTEVARASRSLEAWTWEGRVTLQSGVTRWLRAASRPTRHPDGKMTWDGLLMDVTPEKMAAEALSRREEQLEEAQKIAHIGSWEWDLATGEVTVSSEHWQIFGYQPGRSPWTYRRYLQAIHPDDRNRVRLALERSLGRLTDTSLDYRIVRPDGAERHVTSRGRVVSNDQGRAIRVIGTAQDVTEQKLSGAALEKRVRVERALTFAARTLSVAAAADITRVLGLIGSALGADRAYLAQSRPERETLSLDATHEWCAEGIAPAMENLQGIDSASAPWWTGQLVDRYSIVLNALDELPVEAVREKSLLEMHATRATAAVPLTDGRVGLIGYLGFDYVTGKRAWSDEDVRVLQTTAEMLVAYFSRVKAEQEVVRREGILQAVSFAAERFLRTPDWEAGLEGALALIGAAAGVSRAYLLRTTPGEDGAILVGRRAEWVADGIRKQEERPPAVFASLGELGLGRWEELFRARQTLQALASTLPEPERTRLASQGVRSVLQIPIYVGDEWWGTLGFDNCAEEREWSHTEVEALGTAAGMIAAAVQRQRSEDALRESEERFRQMAESMREVFFMVSADSRELIYLSPSYEEVWGRSRTDPQGFIDSILPEDRPVVFADMALSEAGEGDPLRFIEYRIARPDGSIRWIRHRTFQILDADGHPYRVTGVCSDITEQKQLEEELRRTNRIEAIGHLAAGIAHEINTPIQYIGDNVRFLDESYIDVREALEAYQALLEEAAAGPVPPERVAEVAAIVARTDLDYVLEEAPRASAQALDGVHRVAEIVRAMKEFSHPGSGQMVPTDLNRAIRSTTTVARNEWKYVAELITDLDETLPLVSCLPGELNQAVLNVVVNAAHAIADRQQAEGSTDRGIISVSTANAGDHVEIRVSDTGMGIRADIRARIFDPFFTTKEVGRGTGQGLTFVHTIVVEKHGGTVGVETEEGVGTTFILRIPHEPASAMSEAA